MNGHPNTDSPPPASLTSPTLPNNTDHDNQCTTTANEDFSTAPTPPQTASSRAGFFSRMSSIGSTAAPLLEQVYDRAHKKAAALKETTSLREAVSVVKGSVEKGFLYPVDSVDSADVEGSLDDDNDDIDDSEEEDSLDNPGAASTDDDTDAKEAKLEKEAASSTARSPMKAVIGAYAEFRTTGRYRKSTDEQPTRAESPPVVGGADRVPGLGRLKLNNLVSKAKDDEKSIDGSIGADNTSTTAARSYKRTNSYYEEAVKNLLQPNQRALFFGRGTMGVILKPTYLASWRGKDGGGLIASSPTTKKGGVFIDALVPGGHAERSGVVFVGDHVVKIGNVDVSQFTLEEVVKAIAEAERPSIMILMAVWEPSLVTAKAFGDEKEKRYFVSPLDLAFGFVNKIAAEGVETNKIELHGEVSASSLLDDDDDEDVDAEEVLFSSDSPIKNLGNQLKDCMKNGVDENKPMETVIVQDELDKLITYSGQRTNGHGNEDENQPTTNRQTPLPTLLTRAAFLNPILRSTLHEAFKECCSDPRKANFLDHFFSEFLTRKERETKTKKERDRANGQTSTEVDDDVNDATSSTNQRKLLEIYLDLVRFRDEASVCSTSQLLESARVISAKFLPNTDDNLDQNVQSLSEYVAYIAFGGTDNLQSLKRALTDEDEFFEDSNHDGFYKCRENLGTFLSMQEHFLAFLVSDDCARMRAYLRGTSPFISVRPSAFLSTDGAKNESDASADLLLFSLLHLVCMKESADQFESSDEYGNFIKMDTMVLNQRGGKRIAGAASLLSCPIFIMHTLNQSIREAAEGLVEDEMMGSSNNAVLYKKLTRDIQILWNDFLSPSCGALALCSLSDYTQRELDAVRCLLALYLAMPVSQGRIDVESCDALAKSLTSEEFSTALQTLCYSLIHSYCHIVLPFFRRHIFHEWALTEAASNSLNSNEGLSKINEYLIPRMFSGLSKGYAKRLLRQVELPRGLSSHLPGSKQLALTEDESSGLVDSFMHNADVAVVFGKLAEDDTVPKASSDLSADSAMGQSNIQRHYCSSLHPVDGSRDVLAPNDLPDTYEEYMSIPPFRERPFKGMLRKSDNNRMSVDGWEVSLTNAMIPIGKGSSDMLYSVSLTLSNIDAPEGQMPHHDICGLNCAIEELQYEPNVCADIPPQCKESPFQSPLFTATINGRNTRKMKVSSDLSTFNQELKEQALKSNSQKKLIGISLVSRRNVITAMRHTLSLIYDDLCFVKTPDSNGATVHVCKPLADLLSVFSSHSIEELSMQCILQPYISYATKPWIHRQLRAQSNALIELCGMQVLESLPPVPLALLFVTALLEQKIVFSSSRRSMLMSASLAVKKLMKPLYWTHLLVPHAPLSMVNDLIHYPAPFMLGLSTDEKHSANILRSLPSDVTLVDLDVGRVMLASEFVHDDDDEMDDDTKMSSQSALRSQVLVLAEFLGGIFGSATLASWRSDSPFQSTSIGSNGSLSRSDSESRFSVICNICQEFLKELISGISSCCLWVEEDHCNPSIIFDEDLFIHIKNNPAQGVDQLNLGQFNFLQAFLRTQSLSLLISAGNKS